MNLAANDANKVAIKEAGAIPPLVKLVKDGGRPGEEHAAAALSFLAYLFAVAIAQADGIAPLVKLIESSSGGSTRAKANGAQALANLAVTTANRVAIAEEGAIASLVRLVRQRRAGASEAEAALQNLLVDDHISLAAIAAAGGIPPLQQITHDGGIPPAARLWAHRAVALLHTVPAGLVEAARAKAQRNRAAAARTKRRKAERADREWRRFLARVDHLLEAREVARMIDPPADHTCPITGEAMIDPVVDALGNT